MVIFVNEERAYLSWVTHHRHGFVLDMLKPPTRKRPVLHRAICAEIRKSKAKKTHWTTGRHVKACALAKEELLDWTDTEPVLCEACQPNEAIEQPRHLTKVGKDIVDYVVEAAVISLDQGAEYDASLADIAAYLNKTPAQIANIITQLVHDGYLRTESSHVYPTADALRTLPAFEQLPIREVEAELQQLDNEQA